MRLWNRILAPARRMQNVTYTFSSVFRDIDAKNSRWIPKTGWIQMGYFVSGVLGSASECFGFVLRSAVGRICTVRGAEIHWNMTMPSIKHKSHQILWENLPKEIQENKTRKKSNFIVAWKTLPVCVTQGLCKAYERTACWYLCRVWAHMPSRDWHRENDPRTSKKNNNNNKTLFL